MLLNRFLNRRFLKKLSIISIVFGGVLSTSLGAHAAQQDCSKKIIGKLNTFKSEVTAIFNASTCSNRWSGELEGCKEVRDAVKNKCNHLVSNFFFELSDNIDDDANIDDNALTNKAFGECRLMLDAWLMPHRRNIQNAFQYKKRNEVCAGKWRCFEEGNSFNSGCSSYSFTTCQTTANGQVIGSDCDLVGCAIPPQRNRSPGLDTTSLSDFLGSRCPEDKVSGYKEPECDKEIATMKRSTNTFSRSCQGDVSRQISQYKNCCVSSLSEAKNCESGFYGTLSNAIDNVGGTINLLGAAADGGIQGSLAQSCRKLKTGFEDIRKKYASTIKNCNSAHRFLETCNNGSTDLFAQLPGSNASCGTREDDYLAVKKQFDVAKVKAENIQIALEDPLESNLSSLYEERAREMKVAQHNITQAEKCGNLAGLVGKLINNKGEPAHPVAGPLPPAPDAALPLPSSSLSDDDPELDDLPLALEPSHLEAKDPDGGHSPYPGSSGGQAPNSVSVPKGPRASAKASSSASTHHESILYGAYKNRGSGYLGSPSRGQNMRQAAKGRGRTVSSSKKAPINLKDYLPGGKFHRSNRQKDIGLIHENIFHVISSHIKKVNLRK